jgi:hypothetical protein
MAYTFTEIVFTSGTTFDSLYADSLEDLESGTCIFPNTHNSENKKDTLINVLCNQEHENMKSIEVAKDGVVCMWLQCYFLYNTLLWKHGLVGKINNSKSWTWTNEFHQANKDWIQSIGGTKFALECIKGGRIDTYFTKGTTDGMCLGTLTTKDLEDDVQDTYITTTQPILKRMTWEY